MTVIFTVTVQGLYNNDNNPMAVTMENNKNDTGSLEMKYWMQYSK